MPSEAQIWVRDSLLDCIKEELHNVAIALKRDGINSIAARQLLMLTAATESGFREVAQRRGPAVTLFQMEPDTIQDVKNYMGRSSKWRKADLWPKGASLALTVMQCVSYMDTAVIFARAIYWRDPEPLPEPGDWLGLARYWKRVWNTDKGKGQVAHAMRAVRYYGLENLIYE